MSDCLAKFYVAVMHRVVGDELHLLHIGLAILSKILFIYEDVTISATI